MLHLYVCIGEVGVYGGGGDTATACLRCQLQAWKANGADCGRFDTRADSAHPAKSATDGSCHSQQMYCLHDCLIMKYCLIIMYRLRGGVFGVYVCMIMYVCMYDYCVSVCVYVWPITACLC